MGPGSNQSNRLLPLVSWRLVAEQRSVLSGSVLEFVVLRLLCVQGGLNSLLHTGRFVFE